MATETERLDSANALIETIKSCGRKFFENKHGHDSKLFISTDGNVYFIDNYTGISVCVRGQRIRSTKFSHGGGLNKFLIALSQFVKNGRRVNLLWLGEHWGYGDDLEIVLNKAKSIGFAG